MSEVDPARAPADEHPALERKLLAAVVRHAPIGISITEAPSGRILALSDKAKALLGRDDTGVAIKRYADYPALHPDGRAYAVDEYPTVRALRHGEVVEKEEMLLRAVSGGDGSYRRLEVSSFPVRDSHGRIVAAVTIIDDVEERRSAEERLRGSEERLRLVMHATNDAVMDWDLASDRVVWNEAIRTVFGYGEEAMDVPSGWWTERIHPDEAAAILSSLDAARSNGASTWAGEYRFRRADGSYADVIDRALIVRENGEARRIVGSLLDVSDRRRAETALWESEERLREFGEASSDILWIRGAADGRLQYASPALGQVYDFIPDDVPGSDSLDNWAAFVVPEDREATLANFDRVRRGERVTHEFRVARPDGSIRWLRDKDFPLLDDDGRVQAIAGVSRDVTDEKRASERQALLVAELQHRVRNILAMIGSVARRIAKGSESVSDYSAHFESIVASMARTQALLTRSPGAGVDLSQLLLDEVKAHTTLEGQLICEGPTVLLSSKAAEVLTLTIHELATNSVKYGALSGPDGRLHLSWTAAPEGETLWLRFTWTETGVTPPEGPRREGFGTELVTRRVPFELGGRGAMAFDADRLIARIEFPLLPGDSVLQTDAAGIPTENE
jgi:PAS domain S-box-containing protein